MLKLQDEKKMLAEEIEKIKQNAKDEQNAEVTRVKELISKRTAVWTLLSHVRPNSLRGRGDPYMTMALCSPPRR